MRNEDPFKAATFAPQTDTETRRNRHIMTDKHEVLIRPDDKWAGNFVEMEAEVARLTKQQHWIEGELARVRSLLTVAKSRATAARIGDRIPVDRDWLHKKELELRVRGIEHQQCLRDLADVRKALKSQHANLDRWDEGRMFIECAREMLPPERFAEIWQRVERSRKT